MNRVQSVVKLPVLSAYLYALSQLFMGQDFRPVLFDLIHMRKIFL